MPMSARIAILSSMTLLLSCAHTRTEQPRSAVEASSVQSDSRPTHPLLAPWTGPQGGVPAFDRMELGDLEAALGEGMALHLEELEEIASNSDPPTFDNTIVAMERTGRPLERAMVFYGIWSSNLSTPEFRALQQELAPRISSFHTRIIHNGALFARVAAVHESEELQQLGPEERRLVQLVYDRFARQGAQLTGTEKERYADIQRRLAELHTTFANNVLADEEAYVHYLTADQLDGLPASLVTAAAAAASERGRDGEYAVTNTRSSAMPFLTFSDHRDLREQAWRTYYDRGDNGDERDNNRTIAEILQLRDERSALLGYDTFAHWRLEDRMAGTPEQAMALMETLWPLATATVGQEVADMQAVADADGAEIQIEPWDYRYYAERVRRERYELDSDEVQQYLQLDKLREAMFMVAGELFGFRFAEVTDDSVPVYHEDVRVWEVTDHGSGEPVGLWYFDPFARQGKRSGAWASSYRGHTTVHGLETVLASNNCNFVEAPAGAPVLISWDDATTLFHEFGHALHYLSSRVDYPTLNGGVRDYTEMQSQLLERWLTTDRVIEQYLVHAGTGEPMPAEMVDKLLRASNFNQGFEVTEYLASAILDMRYHTADPADLDPDLFERESLAELGMPAEIVMRHRSPHFGHIFSGEGYAAGYYGYLWADVLTADAAEAFAEAPGGYYDPELAARLVEILFAPRNAIDPAEAYRAFRGRDAPLDAYLRYRGFSME
jgi:peptidyl-dipeptidase Dcp